MKAAAFLCLVAGMVIPGRPGQAAAQAAGRGELSVLLGIAPYDLAGTGTGGTGRLGLSWPPARALVLEPSVGVLIASGNNILLPELSVQVEAGRGRFRPYLGAGAGAAWQFDGNGSGTRATLHAVLGTRWHPDEGWGIRAELRARSVDPWVGETVDLAIGVTRGVL